MSRCLARDIEVKRALEGEAQRELIWRGGSACSNSPYVTRPCASRAGTAGNAPLPKMSFTSLKFERLNRLNASPITSTALRPRTANRFERRTSTIACAGIARCCGRRWSRDPADSVAHDPWETARRRRRRSDRPPQAA